MQEAKVTIIFDLLYVASLCVIYGMNTPSNKAMAKELQVEEIGSAK